MATKVKARQQIEYLPLEDIFIPDGATRREYRNIEPLADSIVSTNGLIHPLVVSISENGTGRKYAVWSGCRRTKSLNVLVNERGLDEFRMVPCIVIGGPNSFVQSAANLSDDRSELEEGEDYIRNLAQIKKTSFSKAVEQLNKKELKVSNKDARDIALINGVGDPKKPKSGIGRVKNMIRFALDPISKLPSRPRGNLAEKQGHLRRIFGNEASEETLREAWAYVEPRRARDLRPLAREMANSELSDDFLVGVLEKANQEDGRSSEERKRGYLAEGLKPEQVLDVLGALEAAKSDKRRRQLLRLKYSTTIHSSTMERIQAIGPSVRDIDFTPEAAEVLELLRAWTRRADEFEQSLTLGRFSPEGASFLASKMRVLGKRLNSIANKADERGLK